jgi:hypothetical protein
MAWVAWRRLADPVWLWQPRNPTTGAAPWPFSVVWLPKPLHDAALRTVIRANRGQLPLPDDTATLLAHATHDHRRVCRIGARGSGGGYVTVDE